MPLRARRASKARFFGSTRKSESSSEESYQGDVESENRRPQSIGGLGSPTSPSSLWAKAFKLGLGGKRTGKRPSSLASDGSSAWELAGGTDEEGSPRATTKQSFEVLHRPTGARSQSATAVEIGSRGRMDGGDLLKLSNAASSSTPLLGNIAEFPEPLGAPSVDATILSDTPTTTPVPTPPIGNSPISTPRPSRTSLNFGRSVAATLPPATSLLSTGRPSPELTSSPSHKMVDAPSLLPLRTRELFLTERRGSECKSSDDDDTDSVTSDPASPTLPASTYNTHTSSAPSTPDLIPSKAAYRSSRSVSSTALKRSTGSSHLARRSPGPSDSDLSLVSTASSTNSEDGEGGDTAPSSAAELDDDVDRRLSREDKPRAWQVMGKIGGREAVSDGADLVSEDLNGAVAVW